jgi:hypothetical protein
MPAMIAQVAKTTYGRSHPFFHPSEPSSFSFQCGFATLPGVSLFGICDRNKAGRDVLRLLPIEALEPLLLRVVLASRSSQIRHLVHLAVGNVCSRHIGAPGYFWLSIDPLDVQEVITQVLVRAVTLLDLQDAEAYVLDGHDARVDVHDPAVGCDAYHTCAEGRVVEVAQAFLLGTLIIQIRNLSSIEGGVDRYTDLVLREDERVELVLESWDCL